MAKSAAGKPIIAPVVKLTLLVTWYVQVMEIRLSDIPRKLIPLTYFL